MVEYTWPEIQILQHSEPEFNHRVAKNIFLRDSISIKLSKNKLLITHRPTARANTLSSFRVARSSIETLAHLLAMIPVFSGWTWFITSGAQEANL